MSERITPVVLLRVCHAPSSRPHTSIFDRLAEEMVKSNRPVDTDEQSNERYGNDEDLDSILERFGEMRGDKAPVSSIDGDEGTFSEKHEYSLSGIIVHTDAIHGDVYIITAAKDLVAAGVVRRSKAPLLSSPVRCVYSVEDVVGVAMHVRFDWDRGDASGNGVGWSYETDNVLKEHKGKDAESPGWSTSTSTPCGPTFPHMSSYWLEARPLRYVRHPRENAYMQTLLGRAEWKQGKDLEYMCDILVLRCSLPGHPILARLPSPDRLWQIAEPGVGDRVILISSPFGIFCPDVFLNAMAAGVVSVLSPSQGLFISDARCIPGSGGGAFVNVDACERRKEVRQSAYTHGDIGEGNERETTETGQKQVVGNGKGTGQGPPFLSGLLLGDIQRAGGRSLELCICLSVSLARGSVEAALLAHPSLAGHSQTPLSPWWYSTHVPRSNRLLPASALTARLPYHASSSRSPSSLRIAMEAIVLVSAGSMWASGVVLDR